MARSNASEVGKGGTAVRCGTDGGVVRRETGPDGRDLGAEMAPRPPNAGPTAGIEVLVGVRSRLTLDARASYASLIRRLNRDPFWLGGDAVEARGVPVRVLRRGIRRLAGGQPAERLRGSWSGDMDAAERYEQPTGDEGSGEVLWAEEMRRLRWAVLLGGPGAGKSFALASGAVALARQALAEMDSQSQPIGRIPLPLHVDLPTLAQQEFRGDPAAMLGAALRAGGAYAPFSPAFEACVVARFDDERTWVLLDALDQVDSFGRRQIETWLQAVADKGCRCRIILTCRTNNYEPIAGLTPPSEYDLVPLDEARVRDLVARWHESENDRAAAEACLEREPRLIEACGTPLLGVLACPALATSSPSTRVHRAGVFATALNHFVRRAGRLDHAEADDLLCLLRPIAFRLLAGHPHSNRFPAVEAVEAIREACSSVRIPMDPGRVREKLMRAGVLIPAGLRDGVLQLSFAHRQFIEYLAGTHLGQLVNEAGWQEARVALPQPVRGDSPTCSVHKLLDRKAWDPAWSEVVLFAAARMRDPGGLLAALWNPAADDYHRHRLALAARCLGEIRETASVADLRNTIATEACCVFWLGEHAFASRLDHGGPAVRASLASGARLDGPTLMRYQMAWLDQETGEDIADHFRLLRLALSGLSLADAVARHLDELGGDKLTAQDTGLQTALLLAAIKAPTDCWEPMLRALLRQTATASPQRTDTDEEPTGGLKLYLSIAGLAPPQACELALHALALDADPILAREAGRWLEDLRSVRSLPGRADKDRSEDEHEWLAPVPPGESTALLMRRLHGADCAAERQGLALRLAGRRVAADEVLDTLAGMIDPRQDEESAEFAVLGDMLGPRKRAGNRGSDPASEAALRAIAGIGASASGHRGVVAAIRSCLLHREGETRRIARFALRRVLGEDTDLAAPLADGFGCREPWRVGFGRLTVERGTSRRFTIRSNTMEVTAMLRDGLRSFRRSDGYWLNTTVVRLAALDSATPDA
jgi:hypothetical protein